MGVAGKHVFACAGFAQDKHRGIGVGKAPQQRHHIAHGSAGVHWFARFCHALRNVRQLVVDLVNKLALSRHLILQLGKQGHVARKGHHKA